MAYDSQLGAFVEKNEFPENHSNAADGISNAADGVSNAAYDSDVEQSGDKLTNFL